MSDEQEDHDREAILARRRSLLARALDGLGPIGTAGAVVVVTATGITASCTQARVCLSMIGPPEETEESESESESESETGESESESETT